MKIIDIGEAFYVLSEIAYMTKDTNSETGNPRIKMFLKGNPAAFTIDFTSIEQRDQYFEEWKNMVVNLK